MAGSHGIARGPLALGLGYGRQQRSARSARPCLPATEMAVATPDCCRGACPAECVRRSTMQPRGGHGGGSGEFRSVSCPDYGIFFKMWKVGLVNFCLQTCLMCVGVAGSSMEILPEQPAIQLTSTTTAWYLSVFCVVSVIRGVR